LALYRKRAFGPCKRISKIISAEIRSKKASKSGKLKFKFKRENKF